MAASEYSRQCTLHQDTPQGRAVMTTWMEERFATVGKKLHVLEDEVIPETGVWTVVEVGARQPTSWIQDHQVDFRRWRSVTDI